MARSKADGSASALAEALLELLAFLELSGDEVVDLDAACTVLEGVAATLQRASPGELADLQTVLSVRAAQEERGAGREDVLEFYRTFFEGFGLPAPEKKPAKKKAAKKKKKKKRT